MKVPTPRVNTEQNYVASESNMSTIMLKQLPWQSTLKNQDHGSPIEKELINHA